MRLNFVRFAFVPALLVLALLVSAAPPAAATPVSVTYQFTDDHCTGGCGLTSPAGSVTLTDASPGDGIVTVQVTLPSGFNFQGGNSSVLTGLVFNSTVALTSSNISNVSSGLFQFTTGPLHQDGFGDFQYGFDCTGCTSGSRSNPTSLSFTVTATGLTISSFHTLGSANTYFSAEVIGSTGNTGPIGTAPVPEPASMMLFGSGLLALGGFMRRFKK
jgi:hypothetical protein